MNPALCGIGTVTVFSLHHFPYLPFCYSSPFPSSLALHPPNQPHPSLRFPPSLIAQKLLNSNSQRSVSNRVPRASSMASSTSTAKPFSVLFVCLGNICRSPAAEGVFRDLVKKKGFDSLFIIDSAGTIDYHEGNPADSRMRLAAKRRRVEITSISRRIKPSDFEEFDLILAMDKQNRADILEAFDGWKKRHNLPNDASAKVQLMCSYCKKHSEEQVPDPYYGGPQGFEKVMTKGVCLNRLFFLLSVFWIFLKMPVSPCWAALCWRKCEPSTAAVSAFSCKGKECRLQWQRQRHHELFIMSAIVDI